MLEQQFTTLTVAAFLATIIAHGIALWIFPAVGLLDFPERYKLARGRLPYPTGVLSVGLFLGFFLALTPLTPQSIGVLCAVLLVTVVSFIDDRTPLPPFPRLFAQGTAALTIYLTGSCLGGRICSIANPLDKLIGGEFIELNGALPVLGLFFTVWWLLLTTNALNWFDGIPGQVHAISAIGFSTIGMLSLSNHVQQPSLALLAFILAGIAAGGLLFDFPRPHVVMGDTGAMFFGLLLGILTIYAGGKIATAFLVLGVPLVDSVLVVLHRTRYGRSPLQGSVQGEHLHHRLLAKGWSQRQVLLCTTIIGSAFGVSALFLGTVGKFVAGVMLFAIMATLWAMTSPAAPSDQRTSAVN